MKLRKLVLNVREKIKFINFISENCPQKDYTYEDRDKVDICKVSDYQNKNRWNYCKPCFECMKHT
jgi:hypothetical protein